MANLWSDGFGRYGTDTSNMLNGSSGSAWAEISGWTLSSANPRTGTYHLRSSLATGLARRVFGAQLTEVFFGYAMHLSRLPPVTRTLFLAKFRSQANTDQFTVWVDTDGSIFVEDASETKIFQTAPLIGAGAYQHIEMYLRVGNGDGAFELRVDEVTRINLTSIDTDAGAGEVSQVVIGQGTNSVGIVDVADCFANDTTDDGSGCHDFFGDCISAVRMVNADTAQADFALSAGVSGYELLDEVGPNDADYIDTSATTAESNFGLADAPANITEILTVRPFVRAWKDDAGTATVAPSMISNAVKHAADSQPIATAPSYYDTNVPLNPDTGAPWTGAEFDAALHVIERTA